MNAIVSLRCAAALVILPTSGAAQAHDAFGDLGPFYGGLLHPLVDPVQGVLLAAMAVLLARQPPRRVRVAFLVLLAGVVLAQVVLAAAAQPLPSLGPQVVGPIVVVLGLLALSGLALPASVIVLLAGGLAGLVGLAGDVPEGLRAALLAAGGSVLGVVLFVLLAWSSIDLLQARLGRIAGAVAGSWIVAIGIMATALPVVTGDASGATAPLPPATIPSPGGSIGSPGSITRAGHDS